jgi:hypothetical protein
VTSVETAVIVLQMWRGRASHFNVGDPADAALFGLIGLGMATWRASPPCPTW